MRDEGLPFFRLDGSVRIPTADLEEWIEHRVVSQRRTDEIVDEVLRDL
jgi:hypothetical protein